MNPLRFQEARYIQKLNTFALSTKGHIGITMLIISGLYLMTPFWKTLNARPLLITKLILVLVLTVSIIVLLAVLNFH
jgi:hypothetical protein